MFHQWKVLPWGPETKPKRRYRGAGHDAQVPWPTQLLPETDSGSSKLHLPPRRDKEALVGSTPA